MNMVLGLDAFGEAERGRHMLTLVPMQPWCPCLVKGTAAPHLRVGMYHARPAVGYTEKNMDALLQGR